MTERLMTGRNVSCGLVVGLVTVSVGVFGLIGAGAADPKQDPQPKAVDPGKPGRPPADAIVLFDGKDLSQWVHLDGKSASWTVADGEITCKPGSGNIATKEKFGSQQLHIEFATPLMPDATGQGRGNSGVYVQGRYEIQVLDSYHNETYANGSCGALYGQYAPLVNVCRPPKEWQTYDIVLDAPKCDASGKVAERGYLTVLHNGVLIHDHVEIKGVCGASFDERECEPGPLMLQDHGNTVKFRNIWLRPL